MAGDHEARSSGNGGCGGACRCGGDAAGVTAEAPVLSIDPRIDVRQVPHGERHAKVLTALDAVPVEGALVLVAPHAPRPLLNQIQDLYPGQFGVEWLQSGPEVWQVRLQRAASA
ncbi:MAG TPA: DUF2249 domain-containing protein [Micromonosporaceae bacterium]